MRTNLKQRDVRFIVQDRCLVRSTSGADGRSYTHRCRLKAFESVAYAVDETPADGDGTSMAEIAKREGLPFTQVNVALQFLKERGIIDVRHRRCYPATRSPHLD